ncbi:MAG: glycoside hydrolase family 15 protein [Candidatus Paceibacterota bacterium]
MQYLPIRDYALIGDCHGSALVSSHGSVDWCCLRRFDADPVFCRLLDAGKGGFFLIQPDEEFDVDREYLPQTNILRTTFHTQRGGRLEVTDFMPVGRQPGSGVHDYVTLNAPNWLVRIVQCKKGRVAVRVRYRPTVEFGRRTATLAVSPRGVLVDDGPSLYSELNFAVEGDLAKADVLLQEGDKIALTVTDAASDQPPRLEKIERLFNITQAFWQEWTDYCRYDGPYCQEVVRSALALKLLTYAPSGALVAAPTTSLPEEIGGERNWDYRYCWLRDATFTLYALSTLGYSGEARRFADFLQGCCKETRPRIQIMYGIGGETELTETSFEHFEGYRASGPVRIGNGAYSQQQLDVYGEVLDWAFLAQTLGHRFDRQGRQFLRELAGFVAAHWQEPGAGIWEMRGPQRHHVHGKIMCWVAIDRVLRMFGSDSALEQLRAEIEDSIQRQGINAETGSLRQAFGEPGTDAALLLTPLVGFPLSEKTLQATITAVEQTLRRGDYVHRYTGDDGLAGSEGAFLICSFWLVDAKLLAGQADEARELFERLLQCSNDVKLYSEEIDPDTHQFLGNFPQAFTHLALIQVASNFALYESRGLEALRGTHADRARYGVEATSGWRALWAAFKKTGRVGRLWSSRASILSLKSVGEV